MNKDLQGMGAVGGAMLVVGLISVLLVSIFWGIILTLTGAVLLLADTWDRSAKRDKNV